MRRIIPFILVILLLPILSADVISLNSGGSNVIVINPDIYINGFFSGDVATVCVPTTCLILGYTCGSVSDGCGGTLNCGTCSSGYTCTSGTCVADTVTPGGGGGGGAITTTLAVTPESISINLAVNTNKEQIISVKNTGSSSTTVSIGQSSLTGMIILSETSLMIAAGETKTFNVVFVALNETGIFTGTINVGGIKIPVSINVKTKLLLFDSNIVVLNPNYKVSQGDDLRTRVTLIPMGDSERLDVTLNYVVKDYSGNVYLTQSETVLVEKRMNFRKNFGTGNLPLGKYIVGLELIYSGGVAPSSAHFEVLYKTATDFLGRLIFVLLIAILLLGILIVLLIIRRRKQKEQSGTQ
jgi:hypothetical protein